MTRISGILLAGGASRRFGRDKLLEPVDGEPLFHRPLRALMATCDEVVVVLAPGATDPPLPRGASSVRFLRDDVAFGGPRVGTYIGLARVRGAVALLAAGDMPGLRAELLDLLARQVSLPGRNAVVLGDGDGPRPLPAALRVKAALTLADELLRGPERRLRALVAGLDAVVLKERVWAEADPRGEWRRDVDVPADLAEAEVL